VSVASPGLFASLRGFAATGLALLLTRLELLKVEAQEEVGRVAALLVAALLAALLAVVGIAFLAALVTVLLWDTHRVATLGVFALLFLGGSAAAILHARRLIRQGTRSFSASLAEIRQDATTLKPGD
jgi:uncharacterized membrane protein YqjE